MEKKYFNLKQGGHFGNKWYEARNMTPEGFSFNLSHGLIKEITEEESKYCRWGSGNYVTTEDGFECICSDWDSSG